MTPNAEAFLKANQRSGVVVASAIGHGGKGGHYKLSDGQSFTLSVEDLRSLPDGYPKWKLS